MARQFLRIEVVDQGPGISSENQDLLFQNIIQFDPNALQGGGGSGLGLYISKGIVDLHGGSIGVFSEGEGKGSVFWIDIPIYRSFHPAISSSFTFGGVDSLQYSGFVAQSPSHGGEMSSDQRDRFDVATISFDEIGRGGGGGGGGRSFTAAVNVTTRMANTPASTSVPTRF